MLTDLASARRYNHRPDLLEHDVSEVRKLWIPGPAGRLEAALRVACPSGAAAVVAHPHPLHGGTLHNPVVFHVERQLHELGWTTLRFNFRGVGDSQGTHDGGRGEVGDVAAAASWLRGLAPQAPLLLVGYSFGAVCALRHAVDDRAVRAVIAVGLPVALHPLDETIATLGKPLAVVQGSGDEFGSPDAVRSVLRRSRAPAELYVVQGCSHLFSRLARAAAARVEAAARGILRTLGAD